MWLKFRSGTSSDDHLPASPSPLPATCRQLQPQAILRRITASCGASPREAAAPCPGARVVDAAGGGVRGDIGGGSVARCWSSAQVVGGIGSGGGAQLSLLLNRSSWRPHSSRVS